ncbi:MAG: heavy metal translocating P-type ATPase [Mailhella sp.]|nr:heavy metal translocating P-type ATPase [Mailhella sp.]
MKFLVIHHIPGRIRLVTDRGFSTETAESLADALDRIDGIEGVRINPRRGSVLLAYSDENALAPAARLLDEAPSDCDPYVLSVKKDGGRPKIFPFIRHFFIMPFMPVQISIASCLLGAIPFLKRCVSSLIHFRFDVEALDGTAIAISILRRDFRTAALLTLLLGFGDQLEQFTHKKSLENLASHLALKVDKVWILRDGVEMLVPFADICESDRVIVRSGCAVPVDGVVAEGTASVNESSMTGEPLGVMRAEGSSVYAGTVVESGEIFIRPTGIGRDTRMQQIVRFIENSDQLKAGIQGQFERLADRAVPFTFGLAALVWLFTRNLTRAASVLLVDYSCALRLATPLAILAGMNEGVRHQVMVKGGKFLESLSAIDTVVFDKTGTLTQSHPEVAEILSVNPEKYTREDILRLSACLEEHFPHPVAKAVVRCAEERDLRHAEEHTEVEYVVAHGIASLWRGKRVLLGSRHYLCQDEGIDVSIMVSEIERLSRNGYSLLYLAVDGALEGIIAMEDPVRPESAALIRCLGELGISHVMMLTGDDERTARAVASKLGISEFRAQVLPEDKASVVQDLVKSGRRVLMLGDGINDSPALSAADVGVTLREGADLAREVADVVLMGGTLSGLVTALELGRGTMRRIGFNYRATMLLNSLFLVGGLTGLLTPGLSAVCHNCTTVGVSVNAMRPVLKGE